MSFSCHSKLTIGALAAAAVLTVASMPQTARGDCGVEIMLDEGWNLICLPLEPSQPQIDAVLRRLILNQKLEQVRYYDASVPDSGEPALGTWRVYVPPHAAPLFPVGLNDLDKLHAGKGYWMKVSEPTSFEVWGYPVQPTMEILDNWNLLGFAELQWKTWDMVFGSLAANLSWLGTFDGESFVDLGPEGELKWLEPGKGLWVKATAGFQLAPAEAERVFPYIWDPTQQPPDRELWRPFVGTGGAGIAGTPWSFRYNEFTFESAGFDIDRSPLACYGVEDTDAWLASGELHYEYGSPWHNGEIDPPVDGRYRMLIRIGAPIAINAVEKVGDEYHRNNPMCEPCDFDDPKHDCFDPNNSDNACDTVDPDCCQRSGLLLHTGGLGTFLVPSQPHIPMPETSGARVTCKALLPPASSFDNR